VRLHLDGSVRETLPPHGTEVFVDGAAVGRVTTSAYHHELGPIALAVVKYMTPDDASVVVGADGTGVAASIDAVVERDTTPRPGQAARAGLRGKSLL
jgi:folate-binding Fe-S cluster repair protein YgfZ